MFASQNRDQLRAMYCEAWRKRQAGEVLEPLESQIADLVGEHPEYHAHIQDPEAAKAAEFTVEQGVTNPFLHMGMHLAIRDQVGMNRPAGIAQAYQALVRRLGAHEAEHAMMECLGTALWEAQRFGRPPDEAAYLECVRKL
ncbi:MULTISPECIES: DUF1841 family protein [Ectothiorhodospira]|uniref:DUF1841 family protein n=1 Tax=Ectothiorhodospira TaxID=1051 RepID=UPI001EE8D506|nr:MULTISPECIES: DUF1841 family protein [Ectothiorhodospira]MCG5495196.1 DUF1841 family protein [Ectothiorhodospira variabilis]MCG5504254.1 DUF1841 family protein [Ectothiorhodospira variabilis]MCG5507409.1 DUF1841 family protein [Ectothiorhodospira variabilis]MCG5525667.1 DUF1841 family protein [Ectothiorhodospira haloalkaliphila]